MAPVNPHVVYVTATTGDADTLRRVLPYYVEPNVRCVTAMYAAIRSNKVDTVKMLLDEYNVAVEGDMFIGASKAVADLLIGSAAHNVSLLRSVILQGDLYAVTALLRRWEFEAWELSVAIHEGIAKGNTSIVKVLLDAGARVTEDVIVAANTTNNPEIVQLIMEHAV